MQVNFLLTDFLYFYMDYQFAIRFLTFINLAPNAKKIMSYDSDLNRRYEQLTKDVDASVKGLREKLNSIERDYIQKIASTAINNYNPNDPFYFLKVKLVGEENAKGLIQNVKPYVDKPLIKFFGRGRFQILTETNFKNATFNDNLSTSEEGYNMIKKWEKFISKPV